MTTWKKINKFITNAFNQGSTVVIDDQEVIAVEYTAKKLAETDTTEQIEFVVTLTNRWNKNYSFVIDKHLTQFRVNKGGERIIVTLSGSMFDITETITFESTNHRKN